MPSPWAGNRGYSNHAYQFDQQYEQYEYEQCNNGNILLTPGVREFYYNEREVRDPPRLPARGREPPCGASTVSRFDELPPPVVTRHNKPVLGQFSPMTSPTQGRRNGKLSPLTSPTQGRRDARFSPVASPTQGRRDGRFSPIATPIDKRGRHDERFSPVASPSFERRGAFGSPERRLGSPERRLGSPERRLGSPERRLGSPERRLGSPERRMVSPSTSRRVDHGPLTSPSQQRRQTIIVSPQRPPAQRPRGLDTSCYSERVSFTALSGGPRHDVSLGSRLDCSYTPVKTSTPRRGDAVNLLPATSPARRGLFQTANRTAVIQPSIYKPTTTPYPEDASIHASWATSSFSKPPRRALATAACFLTLCGVVTCALALYLLAGGGRQYYLDFAFLSGMTAVLLGCLGFRARRWEWLPNRNYMSGYMMVSLFSLGTVCCLLALTLLRPRPGSPLTDLLGGAVCAVSALSLLLASVGLATSHCCKYPPPDNRVDHGVEGFSL